jgi:predicted DNA-binding transcriptional regulator AlpA
VFQTLLAYRQDWFNAERVKALCLIDIVFHNVPSVRAKWKEYYEALSDPTFKDGQNDAVNVWAQKQNVMLAEMAKVLGYGREIGYEEITRSYAPKQYNLNFLASQKMQTELLRVLENSESLGMSRRR